MPALAHYKSAVQNHHPVMMAGIGSLDYFGRLDGFAGFGDVSPNSKLCASNPDPQCPCSNGNFVPAVSPPSGAASLSLGMMQIGAAAASSSIAAAVAGASMAVPLIGAAIAGVTAIVGFFVNRAAQYHSEESAATGIVNQAEVLMKQNLSAWQSTSPKTQSAQYVALQNFCVVWNEVVKACNVTQLAAPGQRCVADRQRGGKWDWFSYYYDPIANDSSVVPDASVSPAGQSAGQSAGASTVAGASAGAGGGAGASGLLNAVNSDISTLLNDVGIHNSGLPSWVVPAGIGLLLVALI